METADLMRFTDNVPKVIDPAAHAVLDYLTAGSFLAVGFAWMRRHPRASTLAFINGASVLAASLLTDYPGGVWRKLSFRTHGILDVMQASMSATMPALLGFGSDPEAQFFHAQAALEAGVIAATDFSAA
jgi:hypothetical protein